MNKTVIAIVNVLGRVLLCTVFFMSAVGNKIPEFSNVAKYMATKGIPMPEFMLMGAIVFLIAGSLSIIFGFRARSGAGLLLIFLVLATYYFHPFWAIADPTLKQIEMIAFMKNLALMGAMLFVIANGSGTCSVDNVSFQKDSLKEKEPTSATTA